MNTYPLGEFVVRLHHALTEDEVQVVWFLGAGCSVSSGIPGAGALVRQWMRKIAEFKGDGFAPWADETYPGWEDDPGSVYGPVIAERFVGAKARQDEIARLVRGKEPGYGYACLAQLMTHERIGHRNNVALTTNFDDLVADALYLYTRQKPLTVAHEALSRFLRSSATVPLVVKVHGDAQLAPRNTTAETSVLNEDLVAALEGVLRDAVFVFVGYAGGDESVERFVTEMPIGQIAAAYWVGPELPRRDRLRGWLESHPGGVHVPHQDFDELMAELSAQFDLGRPAFDRFDRLRERYEATARTLTDRRRGAISPAAAAKADQAVDAVEVWQILMQARRVDRTDPEGAEGLYRQALELGPDDVFARNCFGGLLLDRGRYDEAAEIFKSLVDDDPGSATAIANHANALDASDRADEADVEYRRALALEAPGEIRASEDYGDFLFRRGRREEAVALLESLEADIGLSGNGLSNLAVARAVDIDRVDEEVFAEAVDREWTPRTLINDLWHLIVVSNLAIAQQDLGLTLLEIDAAESGTYLFSATEAQFYRVILDHGRSDALAELKRLLRIGRVSTGWPLEMAIAGAGVSDDDHVVHRLAEVITGTADIGTLDSFQEWRDA